MSDCLFCEPDSPCPAHVVKSKSKPRGKSNLAPGTVVVNLYNNASSIDAEVTKTLEKKSRFASRVSEPAPMDEDDMLLREAVRNLWPILGKQARTKYQHYMTPKKGRL